MATLATVLVSLEDYIHTCISSMAIDAKGSKRFHKRDGYELTREPIEELAGPPRVYQFEIETPEIVSTVYSGSDYTGRFYRFDLKILYPNYEGWTQAALSDHATLVHYVCTNPSSAEGIQACTIDEQFVLDVTPNAKTFILTMKVRAFLEIGE